MRRSASNESDNRKYKQKYSRLKKVVKKYVYENAALCDQTFQMQERVICLREERNYLSKRLANHIPPVTKPEKPEKTDAPTPSSSQKPAPVKKREASTEKAKPRIPKSAAPGKRKTTAAAAPLPAPPREKNVLPIFPIKLNQLAIHSLGEIVTNRASFHTECAVYPVGFCSTRVFGSLAEPTNPSMYSCMILDGGASPLFQISSDVPQDVIISGLDIDAVHSQLLQRINLRVGAQVVSTRGHGNHFFGLNHPSVISLLNQMPALHKCSGYRVSKNLEASREDVGAAVKLEILQKNISMMRSQMETMRQQETLDSTTTLRDLLNS